jgi:hypothetical protein
MSMATVYKNIRLFVDYGLTREVTPHGLWLRVDGNLEPHHHLVCTRCKSAQDIEGDFVNFRRLSGNCWAALISPNRWLRSSVSVSAAAKNLSVIKP